MSNRDYLESYRWKIMGVRWCILGAEPKPLNERIDVEASIHRSLEEREALYMKLNNVTPPLANYWQTSAAEKALIQQGIGRSRA